MTPSTAGASASPWPPLPSLSLRERPPPASASPFALPAPPAFPRDFLPPFLPPSSESSSAAAGGGGAAFCCAFAPLAAADDEAGGADGFAVSSCDAAGRISHGLNECSLARRARARTCCGVRCCILKAVVLPYVANCRYVACCKLSSLCCMLHLDTLRHNRLDVPHAPLQEPSRDDHAALHPAAVPRPVRAGCAAARTVW